MKISVHVINFSLLLFLLVSCTAQTPPAPVPARTPSPEPKSISSVTPTAVSNPSLVAGQWNYLFYHPELKKVILVNGGPDHGKPADDPLELWTWDGKHWALLSADPNGQGPAWRNFAGAAFDTHRNRLIVYGGVQDQDSRMEETWEWDGQGWTQFQVPGPGFREGAAMAYDAAHGKTILYGGANEKFEILGDTWAWDGAQWIQVSTTGPTPRFPSAIVYDPTREKVLLFSGHFVGPNEYVEFSDFWEWDGTAWQEIVVEGEKPGARNVATMSFDSENEIFLLLGGGGQPFLSDMWSWDGMKWTQLIESGTPARSGPGVAFDPERNRLVLFGGVDKPGGTAITDTWEWDGQSWTCIQGCK